MARAMGWIVDIVQYYSMHSEALVKWDFIFLLHVYAVNTGI